MGGRLEGKVALISGGARGQGATEAERFISEGARVVIGDVLDDFAGRTPTADGTPYSVFWALHEDVTRQTPPRSAAMGSIDAALSDG